MVTLIYITLLNLEALRASEAQVRVYRHTQVRTSFPSCTLHAEMGGEEVGKRLHCREGYSEGGKSFHNLVKKRRTKISACLKI